MGTAVASGAGVGGSLEADALVGAGASVGVVDGEWPGDDDGGRCDSGLPDPNPLVHT